MFTAVFSRIIKTKQIKEIRRCEAARNFCNATTCARKLGHNWLKNFGKNALNGISLRFSAKK
jgi:hypothetical protein